MENACFLVLAAILCGWRDSHLERERNRKMKSTMISETKTDPAKYKRNCARVVTAELSSGIIVDNTFDLSRFQFMFMGIRVCSTHFDRWQQQPPLDHVDNSNNTVNKTDTIENQSKNSPIYRELSRCSMCNSEIEAIRPLS